jgi:hypothetical protein
VIGELLEKEATADPTELETQIMGGNQRLPENIITPHPTK